jgi:excinuclease ABC subunit C
MDIKEKIKTLPSSPGVYIMKGASGEALYVGKAEDLRKRASSYFRKAAPLSERLRALVANARDITFIPASTTAEALIYENGLIKQLEPKYNIALRDDKSYPFLKLTLNERFPRLLMTRRRDRDGALYFGPYTSVKLLRQAVGYLKKIFPLRTCGKMPRKACLDYHIGQCPGPCIGGIDEASYEETVEEIRLFLGGAHEELRKLLSEEMAAAAKAEDFEKAARHRKTLEALSAVKEGKVIYSPSGESEELKRFLGMPGPLERIEAFDVSNIAGEHAVGSMICFYKGRPKKSAYRRFRIKTVSGVDDYAMMREIVRRRYRRVLDEKSALPDLIVIDGGRGHLAAAAGELEKMGLSGLPVIGIAKPARPARQWRPGREFERIYMKDRKDPLTLPRESKALHLLERIRDEAHRFAITYHKGLLSKGIAASELDDIAEIGRKRKKALLSHFGSIDKIKAARKAQLLEVDGINEKTAKYIISYFKRQKPDRL